MKTTSVVTFGINTRSPVRHGTTGIGQRSSGLGNTMKLLGLAAALVAIGALPVRASDPVGIYAFVDKVVLEPSESAPEYIQIVGGFALAEGRGSVYTSAQRGYLYFKLKPGKEAVCRNEWADLKSVAGTGKIVGFGMRYANNGTVRKPDTKPENPEVYPVGFGVQKISLKDYKPLQELNALKEEKSPPKKAKEPGS
jgi:hypothetical protein